MDPSEFLKRFSRWVSTQPSVLACALVGSHARNSARTDSDIDLIIICHEPSIFIDDQSWLSTFGEVTQWSLEDWGLLKSIRTHYLGGLEVEFGITDSRWSDVPVDKGTLEVVLGGMKTLYDPRGILHRLQDTLVENTKKN